MVSVAAKKSKFILSLLPEVADLPQTLAPDHKVYWNDFVGEPFQAHIGPRGKKSANARTWTQEHFVGPFCDELYPTLSSEARAQYELILGPKVYSYLTNHSARGSAGVKAKPQTVKQRVYGHDVWRRENPAVFEKVLGEYKDKNPDTAITIGFRRSLTIDLFRKLPKDEQAKYREMASDHLKSIRSLQVVSGEDRAEYAKRLQAQIRTLIKEADQCAGLKINAQILYEAEDGDFHITTLVTDCMAELADSDEVDGLVARMRDWVKVTANKGLLKDGTPVPTVYPDYECDMYPRPPPLIGLRAIELQKILRLEFTLLWGWQGGCGRFPWEFICTNLDEFISPDRRPIDAKLSDPSTLRSSVVLSWLEYITACLDPSFPSHQRLQFSKLFAGLNPIDSSLSQESLRRFEFVPHQNREGWILFFTETVTRCHAPKGLEYPPESLTYAKYLRNATTRAAAEMQSTQRTNPLDLPVGTNHLKAVVLGQEKELILKWANQLPEDYCRFAIDLVDAINELQAHLPATAPSGVWVGQYLNSMPALLPSSPDSLLEGLQYFIQFWLPRGYFSPSVQADLLSRFRYFQLYIEDMLSSPLIRHSPSKTLIGGYNGTVWLVRALILLLFNFAAVNGDLTPPHDAPADCDIACLPLDELPNVLGYCQDLLEEIRKSITILSESSALRIADSSCSVKPQEPTVNASSPSVTSLLHPLSSPSTTTLALPATEPSAGSNAPKSVQKKSRKNQATRREPEDDLGSGESDKSSVDQDWEKLDKHADDEDDLDPDGYSHDLGAGLDGDSIYHPDGRDSHSRNMIVLPSFPDECVQILRSGHSSPSKYHVFGSFPPLPSASEKPLPRSYEPLFASLNDLVAKIEAALYDWGEFTRVNSGELRRDADLVQTAARELPTPLQPLAYFILARTRAWRRAQESAPLVIDFIARIVLDTRIALQLDVAVEEFLEEESRERTIGDAEYDALGKLHKRMLKGGIELCWIYKELVAFENLSSDWSQRMPSNWLVVDDTIPINGPALYDLARPLAEWASASSKLDTDLRAQRRTLWRPTSRPFEVKHNAPLWYWFGNPQPDEMPDGFEACMKAIKYLVDDKDDDDSPNSSPQEPPAPEPASTTTNPPSPIVSKAKKKASALPTVPPNNPPRPPRTRQSVARAATQVATPESRGVTLRPRRSAKGEGLSANVPKKGRR